MQRKFFNFLVYIFAFIGLGLTVGFFAVRFHLTDVAGVVDADSEQYDQINESEESGTAKVLGVEDSKDTLSELDSQIVKLQKSKDRREKTYCALGIIGAKFPINARKIIETYEKTNSDAIAEKMVLAVRLRLIENEGLEIALENCVQGNEANIIMNESEIDQLISDNQDQVQNVFPWMNQEEWQTIAEAILKDKAQIEKAAQLAGIEPRMLVASAIVEQLRLFNSNRELYKKFFSPLKVLGSANKISLGIMGIKESTAIQIENNLKNPESPYYLGKEMENALSFENESNISSERFEKLSSDKNHYPNYLYGAVYLKQMLSQWEKAGYDIKYRPEIVGTLFNVGFPQSKPNPNPKVGGSAINVGVGKYSFGSLAYEFYYSGELLNDFPYLVD